MIRSLRLRLAIGALVAVFLALAAIWVALSDMFSGYMQDRYQAEMSAIADNIAASVFYGNGRFNVERPPADPRFDLPAGGRYWQLSAKGQPSIRSASLWDTEIRAEALAAGKSYGFSEMESPDGSPMLVYATRSSLSGASGAAQKPFWIYCAFPKAELTTALSGFQSQLSRMIALTATFLIGAALLQNFVGLAPLSRLRRKVADIRAGDLHALEEDGPSETLPLVREINLLLGERESAVERARARASDLAHGLKTPLTALVQLVQELPGKERETALKQIDLIRQRSDRQLQSARLGVEQMAATRIADIVQKLVQVLRPATMEKNLQWHVLIDPALAVATDPADLAEAMGNVLENAGKWARGNILVRADASSEWTDIRIADDGPGADAADYERLLRRGVHMEHEQEGHGLGLAISADIAIAYGGTLSLGRSEMGGLEVTLRFPTAAAQTASPA